MNLKPELSKKSTYWIPKERYYELKHFCLQYDNFKKSFEKTGLKSLDLTKPRVVVTDISDPIADVASFREIWRRKMMDVEHACKFAADDETMADILKEAVTNGLSYEKLEAKYGTLPVSRDEYYDTYRKAFFILDKLKE